MKTKSKYFNYKNEQTIANGDFWKNGVILEKDEIFEISDLLSSIYIELIEKLTLVYSNRYSIPQNALRVLFRPIIVSITHSFFERLIRLNKIINTSKCKPSVQKHYLLPTPDTVEDFNNRVMTEKFNQSLISLLSDVWKLNKISGNKIIKLDLVESVNFKNNLFQISKTRFTLSNISILFCKYLNWIPPFGRFPVLNLSASIKAFHKHLFYLNHFKEVNLNWLQPSLNKDLKLRKKLFSDQYLETIEINNFLTKYGFSKKQKTLIADLFFKFMRSSFPLQLIEGFYNNYKFAKRSLSYYDTRALIFSGTADTKSLFVLCVAKSKSFKIIDIQHGGHYGYLKDVSPYLEVEFPMTDEFLSWGWQILPKSHAFKDMRIRTLPSPWLSERKIYWKNLIIDTYKPFDILWMPSKIKRFTGSPQGGSSSRHDVIDDFSLYMVGFLKTAVRSEISVYCKPCDLTSSYLMANTLKNMKVIGGDFFECSDKIEKGLTYELLSKGKLVLWDYPGTGFLESIACGIPTMILWTRFFCEEEIWCKKDFNELEKVGVIHQTLKSLIKEIEIFLKDPNLWMNNLSRKVAIKNFSNKYALTSVSWPNDWKKYLKDLKAEINDFKN